MTHAIATPDSLTIRWVGCAAEAPAGLWEACFSGVVEGRWWYEALENSRLEDQFTFAYGVISRGTEPIGIAPTFIMNVPMDLIAPPWGVRLLRAAGRLVPRVKYQRTLFVGSPCSDEGVVGLVRGESLETVAPALQAALLKRARTMRAGMLLWKDFGPASAQAMERLCDEKAVFRVVSFPGTVVDLRGGSFEAYLQTLRGDYRYSLRKKLRRSRAQGPLLAEVLQRPNAACLDEIFALFQQTYEKGKTKFERLNGEFFRRMAACPECTFLTLRLETGKMAAFMLCFLAGDKAINKFIGMDYSLGGDWYLYFRLWEQAVLWATAAGAKEIQSGQTGYQAKHDLGHSLIPLNNYVRHRNVVLHPIYKMAGQSVTWADLDADLARRNHDTADGVTPAPQAVAQVGVD